MSARAAASRPRPKPVTRKTRVAGAAAPPTAAAVVAELRGLATKATRDGMARYGIPSDRAFGVPMSTMQQVAKRAGKSQALADALWRTGHYEARIVACYVGEPAKLTPASMDRWCRDFDNWAVVDTACFVLFDRSPHALGRVAKWAARKPEFAKRAAFALLACVALHDRTAGDAAFAKLLPLVEKAAADERNFVKKGVSWALRSVGRRSLALHTASVAMAKRLAAADSGAARWVGRDALKDLQKPALVKKLRARG